MVDQQRLLGIHPDLSLMTVERPDPTSIDVELGEIAEAVARREKLGELVLGDKTRAALVARVERAQAVRGARLVRAAGEAVLNAPAPVVGPDTVWSGDLGTLVELFQIGLYRVNVDAAYFSGQHRYCAPAGFLREQP